MFDGKCVLLNYDIYRPISPAMSHKSNVDIMCMTMSPVVVTDYKILNVFDGKHVLLNYDICRPISLAMSHEFNVDLMCMTITE